MCDMLMEQWTNQQWFISFQNFVLPAPESVGTSLPQGDPWSLLDMFAVLCPAIWEIDRTHAQVTNFVDVIDLGPPPRSLRLWMFFPSGKVGPRCLVYKKTRTKLNFTMPRLLAVARCADMRFQLPMWLTRFAFWVIFFDLCNRNLWMPKRKSASRLRWLSFGAQLAFLYRCAIKDWWFPWDHYLRCSLVG